MPLRILASLRSDAWCQTIRSSFFYNNFSCLISVLGWVHRTEIAISKFLFVGNQIPVKSNQFVTFFCVRLRFGILKREIPDIFVFKREEQKAISGAKCTQGLFIWGELAQLTGPVQLARLIFRLISYGISAHFISHQLSHLLLAPVTRSCFYPG